MKALFQKVLLKKLQIADLAINAVMEARPLSKLDILKIQVLQDEIIDIEAKMYQLDQSYRGTGESGYTIKLDW